MDRDFEIGGKQFKLGKIDAFKQFHIVRRVGPILSDLIPAMKDAGKFSTPEAVAQMTDADKADMFGRLAAPVMTGLAKLSDADADIVLKGLLAAVEVKQSTGNWARVAQGDMVMIQDLELPVMLNIAGRAFMYNLSGFFAALPQK